MVVDWISERLGVSNKSKVIYSVRALFRCVVSITLISEVHSNIINSDAFSNIIITVTLFLTLA